MRSPWHHIALLAALSFGLSGCGKLFGDLTKKEVIRPALNSDRFSAGCDLDVDRFSKILEENIEDSISCLKANLTLFIKVVESGKPGYLSRVALEQFLLKNRPEFKPDMIKALKSVFDINYLITGEDRNFISQQSIDQIVEFAVTFNREAAKNFGPTFGNKLPATFGLHLNHRERVKESSKIITVSLLKIFNQKIDEVRKLNIIDLLDSFNTDEFSESIEKVKKVLFVKKVLLGGENEIITHRELFNFIVNFYDLSVIALDAVRYEHIKMDQKSLLGILQSDLKRLNAIIFESALGDRSGETLATIEEVFEAVNTFIPRDDFDVEKFRGLILEMKQVFMGGDLSNIQGRDLKTLFTHGLTLLKSGTIFHDIYTEYEEPLKSPLPLTIKFDSYRQKYPDYRLQIDQFERIVKSYRFLKGNSPSAYFSRAWQRNRESVFEIAALEYAITILMQKYGSPSNGLNGYSMTDKQVLAFFKKFEKELVELRLILPRRARTTSDTVSLLGILFQYQSDDNNLMDVNEFTEFAVTLLTSLDVGADLDDHFSEKGCPRDRFGRVEPVCFKQNFFQGVCKNYRKYFPLMFESLGTPASCDDIPNNDANQAFLEVSIKAARICHVYDDGAKEEIYYSKEDMLSVMIGLMHVETTMLRWDVNQNNVMDYDEVMRAYSIYAPALDSFLVDKPAIVRKFKKQIYQYLVKYESVPDEKEFKSIWRFIRFLVSFNKQSTANRKTISSILYTIAQQTALLPTDEPPFLCRWMRDPENIPLNEFVPQRAVDIRPDYSHLLAPYLKFARP